MICVRMCLPNANKIHIKWWIVKIDFFSWFVTNWHSTTTNAICNERKSLSIEIQNGKTWIENPIISDQFNWIQLIDISSGSCHCRMAATSTNNECKSKAICDRAYRPLKQNVFSKYYLHWFFVHTIDASNSSSFCVCLWRMCEKSKRVNLHINKVIPIASKYRKERIGNEYDYDRTEKERVIYSIFYILRDDKYDAFNSTDDNVQMISKWK